MAHISALVSVAKVSTVTASRVDHDRPRSFPLARPKVSTLLAVSLA
jgi:hypothetical protein